MKSPPILRTFYDSFACWSAMPARWSTTMAVSALWSIRRPSRPSVSRRLDAAIGLRVRENVIAAYRFLVRTYQPDDQIFLFGFSRGAYTVRAVAGMIHHLGLLRPDHDNLAPLAWAVYANEAHVYTVSQRFGGGNRFQRCFGITPRPRIHLVGVWDTVSAFGWIWNFQTLPFTATNPSIDHIRHALAIDERRACFEANLFFPREEQLPRCKQVWFAGVHADVGGGYPEKEATLSKVSLTWMLREAQALGLRINAAERDYLMNSEGKPPADSGGPIHDSMIGLWKLMESLPRRGWDGQARQMRWQGPHRRRRRPIAPGSVLHASVLERMQKTRYAPPNLPGIHDTEY